jgi:glycosyltransferase involved in cell wall biosynthesis
MNKTMEYMAFELPVVAFDLKETHVSADNAATYVEPNDVVAYAHAIAELLGDPERRRQMGQQGRQRVVDVLAWRHQAPHYVSAYERLCDELRAGRAAARV